MASKIDEQERIQAILEIIKYFGRQIHDRVVKQVPRRIHQLYYLFLLEPKPFQTKLRHFMVISCLKQIDESD